MLWHSGKQKETKKTNLICLWLEQTRDCPQFPNFSFGWIKLSQYQVPKPYSTMNSTIVTKRKKKDINNFDMRLESTSWVQCSRDFTGTEAVAFIVAISTSLFLTHTLFLNICGATQAGDISRRECWLEMVHVYRGLLVWAWLRPFKTKPYRNFEAHGSLGLKLGKSSDTWQTKTAKWKSWMSPYSLFSRFHRI